MCGFAGIAFARVGGTDGTLLDRMAARVRHRGPDAEGRWCYGDTAMVHCRLRVIDLSVNADQPMQRRDLDAVIAFNGELYNYEVLGEELRARGMHFETRSDTEVLLATLSLDGPDALRRARGMFALACWRPEARELLLARDPMGKKPLFWSRRDDGAIVFGSTIGAVVEGLGSTPAVRPGAVAQFLHHLVVPQHTCIYEGIERVQPGSWIRFGEAGRVERGRHWDMPEEPSFVGSAHELGEAIELSLRAAIRRRLVADVPVGAFLSAGKDSGLIVALAAEEATGTLRTFTAGTTGSPDDERDEARQVAIRYGTDHEEVEVPPLSAAGLPRLLAQAGEPFADASLLPTAAVAAAARGRVTVALTGDGGDELFFGYSTFGGVRVADIVRRSLPSGVLRLVRPLIGDGGAGGWRNKADAVLQYASEGFNNRMGWDPAGRARLLGQGDLEAPEAIYRQRMRRWSGLGAPDALRRTLLETRLPDDYLTKIDLATMAVALEARSPFLDIDLVQLALAVPARVAFPGGRAKALLAPLVGKLLPPSLGTRRKTGFGVPVRQWLLGPLRGAFARYVLEPGRAIRDFVDADAAADAYVTLERGHLRADRVWALFVLGVWAALAIDRDLSPDEPLSGVG